MPGPNRWSPKWLREALASQQTYAPDEVTSNSIDYLIAILDSLRPVGSDGVHGDRHTETCGCEDRERLKAKAEALRTQRDFFRAIDMDAAADHCEQAATSCDSSVDDLDRIEADRG